MAALFYQLNIQFAPNARELKSGISCRLQTIPFVDSSRKETWLPMQNPSINAFCSN